MPASFKALLENWSTQQDYLWFLALLAWSAVLAAELRRKPAPPATARAWLIALAAGSALGALLELVLLAQDLKTPYTRFDFLMGAASAAVAAALVWPATAGLRRAALVRGVAIVALAGLAGARLRWPVEAGWALAAVQATALLAISRRFPGTFPATITGLLVAQPVLAAHGPWAYAIGQGRDISDLSNFSLLAAGLSGAIGLALAIGAWRRQLAAVDGDPALARDLRRALGALGFWLAIGVLLAVWFGRHARRTFEESLLRRVETVALALDPDAVAEALAPELKITAVETKHYDDGSPVDVATVPHTVAPVYPRLLGQLYRVRQANADFYLLYLATWRDGRLLVLNSTPRPGAITHVIHHAVTSDDLDRLAARRSFSEGPTNTSWGTYFSAKAPLFDPARHRVLGWLVADVEATRWAATFAQARLQTMALVTVGVGLWAMAIAYRLRRAARELSEQKAATAAAADRMKSVFLAQVSHELRTPIQSVLGYSELLAGAPLSEPHRAWLAALRTHGAVMLRLVNDLIDLGALQSGRFQLAPGPVNLRALVEDCALALRPAATAKGLALHLTLSPHLPGWVTADGVRLRQILLNLLNNAIKFTVAGEVRLALALAPDGRVEFLVTDTGPGLPAALHSRLFQPFARLAPPGEGGSGLGLALVRALCVAMQGEVSLVESTAPGATFLVRLPLAPCAAPAGEPPSVATTAVRNFAGLRLLVAEDNTLVRELLAAFLAENGAEVSLATDGPTALRLARSRAPDVLLLDIALPGLDGIGVADTLRREGFSRLRIIGLSAHAGPADETRARAAGMDAFLAKPVSLARLAEAIHAPAATAFAPAGAAERIPDPQLRSRLWSQFSRETPPLLAELRLAALTADWPQLRSRTHYLKNSADVLGAGELQTACAELTAAADRRESATVAHLLGRIEAATALLIPGAIPAHPADRN